MSLSSRMVEGLGAWFMRRRGIVTVAVGFWGLGLYMGWGNSCGSDNTDCDPDKQQPAPAAVTVSTPTKQKRVVLNLDRMHEQVKTLTISEASRKLAEVRTTRVVRKPISYAVQMMGKVTYDQSRVSKGSRVTVGTLSYTMADMTVMWVMLQAREQDSIMLEKGQRITFTMLSSYHRFSGKILSIAPAVDPKTGSVWVHASVVNPKRILKAGMSLRGAVRIALGADGRAKTHATTKPKGKGKRLPKNPLLIPSTAPLFTNHRAIVYVSIPGAKKPSYQGREVLLGPRVGAFFVVRKGLKEGDEVVSHGAFQLDSELQIRTSHSMMSGVPAQKTQKK